MPVYEFECPNGHLTEELVRMGTKTTTCPRCKKRARKIISPCSFDLKGGGWYADGYASKKSGSSPKKAPESTTKKSDSSPAKSD
jgi:putative FmdB family regulatory protein